MMSPCGIVRSQMWRCNWVAGGHAEPVTGNAMASLQDPLRQSLFLLATMAVAAAGGSLLCTSYR